MMAYPEVPELWYLGITIFAVVLGCIALTVYPCASSFSFSSRARPHAEPL
jgi:hypothetical protein